ncbi:ribonuclease BN [Methylobacterium sp. Leaf399]|uniref:YihY/virulence factor BrkB family protein n=1 Tax=unclassified Methylobacterium TaxID=2615210 RepID=UPI0006F3F551|nr:MULTISPECIES: YihY/virulence factor BrkB family protein [unclassified Methylobacterium]KQP51715.1 ribonuclease BN [Methylobacterium sp. Leaf108]KQT14864.1 ribonuclease BN [Methylobacterium sp. Leaf399]KQT90529.1 ribonuclease BN [Methylobacterium sp. Leaf466]
MSRLRTSLSIAAIAAQRFVIHDGWAIASHIALSSLTSLFPFLILLAAVAGLFGTKSLADEAGVLIFDAWPREVAKPIVGEMHRVLTEQRGGVLTVGAVLALYFSSSGVESLRVGLNRAYGLRESRPWWLTRLESIGYVVCGAFAMLAFALLVVLGPLLWRTLIKFVPGLEPLGLTVAIGRIGITATLIAAVLIIAHKFVATGRRPVLAVLPGVAVTLLLWFLAGLGFGFYLDRFSTAYASTYGGLATAMVFLVFLYWLAAMFLFGGEINGTVIAARRRRLQARMQARRNRALDQPEDQAREAPPP